MTRDRCGGCNADALTPFLDLGSSPLADVFPDRPDADLPRYPLRVAVCRSCWLVQLLDVVPDADLFGAHYGFYSSASPSIRAYDHAFADWALSRFGAEAKRGVMEIACNDGSLLQHFAAAGVPAFGVEPATGPAQAAIDRGLTVSTRHFSRSTADVVRDDHGWRPGLVIAKNVAAHVADLGDFFAGIAHLIGDDGVAVVEVQDVAALLLGNQIDHVYHEHRYYFSTASLGAAAWRAGLVLVEAARTAAQGGSIRATLRRLDPTLAATGVRWSPTPNDPLCSMAPYAAMQHRAELLRERLLDLLDAELAAGRTVVGYAATAKSATLLNWCGIGPDRVQYIEDTTPAKIGRYAPGTGIPIVEQGERPYPNTRLLLAWNYLGDVLERENGYTMSGGRWIVPIPVPAVI
nr:class I SAM-dependent methyltransferase [Micromonospora sp. DSM 115978]